MKYDPFINHRRSIRLSTYDYRSVGAYFVTICTFQRDCFLDEARSRRAVELAWRSANGGWELKTGDFIVMPNHVHGVVLIREKRTILTGSTVRAQRECDRNINAGPMSMQRRPPFDGEGVAPLRHGSLGEIVRMFKSLSTKRVNGIRQTPGLRVWQRNYYERVIRDEDELRCTRQYILDNPAKWESDPNNPAIVARRGATPSG